MPRINRVLKATQRAEDKNMHCSASSCGKQIMAGQSYTWIKFRYGGKRVHCSDHPNWRRGELTQSMLGPVYDAQDAVGDALSTFREDGDVSAIEAAIDELKEAAEEARSAYEEAAEPFQGQGENAERAEALEAFISELDNLVVPDQDDITSEECQECEGTGEVENEDAEPNPDNEDEVENVECPQCGGEGTLSDSAPDEEAVESFASEVESAVDSLEL